MSNAIINKLSDHTIFTKIDHLMFNLSQFDDNDPQGLMCY